LALVAQFAPHVQEFDFSYLHLDPETPYFSRLLSVLHLFIFGHSLALSLIGLSLDIPNVSPNP